MTVTWTNVTDPIFENAQARPDAVAVIDGQERLTFRAFASLVARCTAYLAKLGIKSGDRVGVRMNNSADHVILSLALLRMGAVKFEIAGHSSPGELEAVTRKFSLSTLFLEPPVKLYKGARCVVVDLAWREAVEKAEGDVRHDDSAGEPWFVNLTSGSTGSPRGIPVTHRQMIERSAILRATYGETGLFSPDTNYLQFGSLGFAGIHAVMLHHVMAGATIVPSPEFAKVYDYVRFVGQFDDAVAMVLPAMCDVFVSCVQKNAVLFPNVRAMVAGGNAMSGETKKAMLKVTPNFYEIYGASGSGWISLLRPEEMGRRSESVGKALPGMEVEIVDAAGKPVGKNQIGHLRCRSDLTAENYLLAEDAAAGGEGFRDGWYYPGDLAQRDGSGYLFLKGRASEIIRRRDTEVYPAEVEAALASHASVKEVCVVGVRTRQGGLEVVALVVPKEEPRHEELVEHCSAKLSAEKRPAAITYVDALPRTAVGKVDKRRAVELSVQAIQRTEARILARRAAKGKAKPS